MKLYFWSGDIPELSRFPASQRRRVILRCLWKALRRPRFWMFHVLPFCALLFGGAAAFLWFFLDASWPVFFIASVALILFHVGVSVIAQLIFHRLMLPLVREELPGLCSTCGYNLTGNTSGVCPECGAGGAGGGGIASSQ